VDLSAFYLDVRKDRLYCERADGPERRATQTVLHAILDVLVRLMAPVLSFTAEEVWRFLPGAGRQGSVLLAGLAAPPVAGREPGGAEGAPESPLVPGLRVLCERAPGEKCPRCWNLRALGQDPRHPDLCERCAGVVA